MPQVIDPFVHDALYYSDVNEFHTSCSSFVLAGLAADEAVMVAVPEPRLSMLRSRLPVDRVTFHDMGVVGRNPMRIIPQVLLEFANSHSGRVRIIGEPIFEGRTNDEIAKGIQHEALINVAFAGRDVTILCPYDTSALPHVLPYAERTHPTVVALDGTRRDSRAYTDPYTVIALFNQPLPERRSVDASLEFNAAEIGTLWDVVWAYGTAVGLSSDRASDLQKAAIEIGTHVTAGSPSRSTVRLWTDNGRVVCEIAGPGQMDDFMSGRTIPPWDGPGAKGLAIADSLCDLVQSHASPASSTTRLHVLLPSG